MRGWWLLVGVLAAAHGAQAEESALERAARKTGKFLERGANAVSPALDKAGNAIDRGVKATGRGVERGGRAVQRTGSKVHDKVDEKVRPKK